MDAVGSSISMSHGPDSLHGEYLGLCGVLLRMQLGSIYGILIMAHMRLMPSMRFPEIALRRG